MLSLVLPPYGLTIYHSSTPNSDTYTLMFSPSAPPYFAYAASSDRPITPYSNGVNTVVGTISYLATSVSPALNNLLASSFPAKMAVGVNSGASFYASPIQYIWGTLVLSSTTGTLPVFSSYTTPADCRFRYLVAGIRPVAINTVSNISSLMAPPDTD